MILRELLKEIAVQQITGCIDADIATITDDSRDAGAGSLYVAVRGMHVDGHTLIGDVVRKGAIAIVAEQMPDEVLAGVTYVVVEDSSYALGQIASAFNGYPSRKLKVVGVTGTDGKTTTATLLHRIATAHGYKAGLLSTIRNVIVDIASPAAYTTPNAIALQATFAEMYKAGCEYVFMEVSSHSVAQKRIAGTIFAGGIFTNLTNCHLDYHDTMESYFSAKRQFFGMLPSNAFALTNIDDLYGDLIVCDIQATSFGYSSAKAGDYSFEVTLNALNCLELRVNETIIQTGLVGRFNAYNVTAAFAASVILGFDVNRTVEAFRSMMPVEGRFDWFRTTDGRVGVVDYAHTPNALTHVLKAAREVFPKQRIVLVIGCQGEPHDIRKRPVMGRIAAEQADCAVFTSMNPRWESPGKIFDAMLSGVELEKRHAIQVIPDREEAIRRACELAVPDGVVLVAGRGHVRYHHVKGARLPLYDKDVLSDYLCKTTHISHPDILVDSRLTVQPSELISFPHASQAFPETSSTSNLQTQQ